MGIQDNMAEVLVCLTCCLNQPRQRVTTWSRRHAQTKQSRGATSRGPGLDKSMIGCPTNFVHTGHIGSTDYDMSHVNALHSQMQAKGGYDYTSPVSVRLQTRDLQQ